MKLYIHYTISGGDSDTIAAITGGIEVANYKEMSDQLVSAIEANLTPDMEDVCKRFAVFRYRLCF